MARRKDRPGPLEPRSEAILRAIIEEYVATAAPVGSLTLVAKYRLQVSPATVRNVMAELEAAGYIGHPHTSAGRVPTDAGYRLYVESIAETVLLAPVEQLMIRHQFGQVEFASEQWFRLAAATLAGATHVAGLATPAKPIACRVRRVDLVPNGSRTASLVLVLAEGPVKQVLLNMNEPRTRAELDAIVEAANVRLAGSSVAEVEQTLAAMRDEPDPTLLQVRVVERVAAMMRDFDADSVEDLFSEGLLNVMAAPEFSQSEKLRRVFGALQDRHYIGGLARLMAGRSDVHVFIGSENDHEEMHDVSLVLAPYGRPGQATGVIGVLGPTRMAYPHAISTVRYVSGLMNELVDHLYA
ncbi:MAG: heat-inducible transcription repressor HrcA [Chloroflexi bacterium]|nr:heat-inducible transcription repressor HrcA [Chloroflexota bacterium]MDQ3406970.1 heat-inducible transcriptional repressor HrcA [Chloroflexota bacterium]